MYKRNVTFLLSKKMQSNLHFNKDDNIQMYPNYLYNYYCTFNIIDGLIRYCVVLNAILVEEPHFCKHENAKKKLMFEQEYSNFLVMI